MKWDGRSRCALVCLFFALLFSIFSWRLIYLQMVMHDYYTELAAEKNVGRDVIPAQRGAVYDSQDEILAQNVPVATVVADATLINQRSDLVLLLADQLHLPPNDIAEKIATGRRYIVLKREVPEAEARKLETSLRSRKLRGVYCERETVRVYPNGPMLCHVIGFTDFHQHGIQGVEASMDQYLRGEDGYRYVEHDAQGREIVLYRGTQHEPRDGRDVHLTIDLHLQTIVENELDAAMRDYAPEKATIILMRPQTGEILALANRPNFDLNERAKAKPEQMKNRAIIDMMEPGSVFKIVTAAAALNEAKVRLDTMIFCENGVWNVGGRPLHDHGHKGYGDLSVQDILVHSSNIGAAKMACMLGDLKFYEYIRRFGFGDRTGIDLPGEIRGVIHPPKSWSKISITRMPMGQEVGVTPLQMISAMATIANGGQLVQPRIVKSIVDNNGKVISLAKPTIVRQVVSRETAAKVAFALRGVVSKRGTAAEAAVPGYTISGKTGTAQKAAPGGGYEKDKYVVSFSGFLPSENPAFVGLVVLDDAHTKEPYLNYGGTVAGPIFARVAEQAARYLDLEPHEEIGTPASTAGRVALTNGRR
jgi:cell division protein FtsI (penicillin-binding protein 3)/stage V sporulation protein D (sporulation-specific penicillin-binding protein)